MRGDEQRFEITMSPALQSIRAAKHHDHLITVDGKSVGERRHGTLRTRQRTKQWWNLTILVERGQIRTWRKMPEIG